MSTRKLIPIAGLAVAALATGAVATAASTKTVTMKNIKYSPSAVTIKQGDKVKWLWRDGSIRHDVRFSSGGFKRSPLKSSGSFTLTFKKRGTFRYICTVHPGDMKGRVTVR